jgi:hypothetical protein
VLTAGRPEQLVDLQGGPDEVDDHQVCQARPGGGLAQVSVKNPERRALGRWNVEWSFAGDERITYLWGGDVHQDGASVTVGNGRFNGRVKPGHRTTFGFLGTTRSSALPVDDLWVDGRRCAVAG